MCGGLVLGFVQWRLGIIIDIHPPYHIRLGPPSQRIRHWGNIVLRQIKSLYTDIT